MRILSKSFGLGVVLMSAFLSAGAHADGTCVGQICIGTLVIDSSDYLGTVIAVGPQNVTYTIPGYNPTTASPSSLSPETQSLGALTAGVTVIDSNDYIAKVNHVFAN